MKTRTIRETEIEKYLCDQIKALGGIAYKFVSPGNRGVPDRLCVLPNGLAVFVEVKSPTGELHPTQKNQIRDLLDRGHNVRVVSSSSDVNEMIAHARSLLRA